jgi:very-short-patch-repair endonuclease
MFTKSLSFFRELVKPWSLDEFELSHDNHAERVKNLSRAFLVGQSAVANLELSRYESCDDLVHIGLTRRLSKRQRDKFRRAGYVVHYLKSYSQLDALLPLLLTDNPISLICTFCAGLRKKLFTITDIEELLQTSFKGVRVLAEIYPYLSEDFGSDLEVLFNLSAILQGFRPLETQIVVGDYRADFGSGDYLIECDGFKKYDGKSYDRTTKQQIKHEHLRDSNYALHGYKTLHFHWEDLYTVENRIETLLTQIGVPRDNVRSNHLCRLIEQYLERRGPWWRPQH